jgi:uncharacterized protein (TIGR00106 family)
VLNRLDDQLMALLEFSVSPMGKGESVSEYVARCVEIVESSGLDYEVHAMGTIVEGELDAVLDVMRRSIETVAADCERVSCTAKIDLRRGHQGAILNKVASVERLVGHPARRVGGQRE